MKKNFLIAGALLVMACGALTYCFASSSQPSAADATAPKNEIVSSVKSPKGKILIAYFTSPETDGVDAVAGASRVIVDRHPVLHTWRKPFLQSASNYCRNGKGCRDCKRFIRAERQRWPIQSRRTEVAERNRNDRVKHL